MDRDLINFSGYDPKGLRDLKQVISRAAAVALKKRWTQENT
jgi:hypothetical protein